MNDEDRILADIKEILKELDEQGRTFQHSKHLAVCPSFTLLRSNFRQQTLQQV